MEAPLVANSLIELLERSGLVPAEEIAAATERLKLREQPTPKDAARLLVREGLITRFQAERLLEGRYRGFFIEHFKVLEILGAGGMACLYLAEDMRSGEQFALKVLSDKHKSDAGMLARLKLETRAGKKLHHSSIIRTYGIHRADDVFGDAHYLVMEYVEGVNLEELINLQGPIAWQQAADFARQAAAGLQHAHQAGLVHRDVKPGNLLVDARGCVKILDFGLALIDSAEDDEFSLTMIFGHSCLGTADYIAPEQTIDSFAIDARADVYSLGCTLYVALTGKLPFPVASTNQKLDGHRNHQAPPLRGIVPDVPVELAAIVEKMMAKRPDDRYQTMAAVAEALAPFAKRLPVEFDFPQVLAWRAKEARRRFAAQRRATGASSVAQSSWAVRGLTSASTRRLPQVSADTAVENRSAVPQSSVSLVVPFPQTAENASLSRPELSQTAPGVGPALLALETGERVPLSGNRFVIGRDAGCDLTLPFGHVSGRHCELRFDGTLWHVVDLQSKNGVQVNGIPATDHLLLPGDRLTIARQHQFRVEYPTFSPLAYGRSLQVALFTVLAATVTISGWYLWRLLVE
jgi:eukaryotic-like serine/threonine-protein kinase